MNMVRQRMIKPFKNKFLFGNVIFLMSFLTLVSCNVTEITGTNVAGNVVNNSNGKLDNKAYIYRDSPYILGGKNVSTTNPNMGRYLSPTAELITTNTNLTGNCGMNFFFYGDYSRNLASCIRSLGTSSSTIPTSRKEDRTYIFTSNSAEFYQTNALYHIQLGADTFFKKLKFAYNRIQAMPLTIPKSIPSYLKDSNLFWFKAVSNTQSEYFKYDFLTSYAQCDLDKNASFSPAGPELCFGHFSSMPGFYFVQDPTIIYHEFAHALVSIMMNMRNGTSTSSYHALRSNLGGLGYDEAGSINEGIADYYSFVINKRTHIGEWALGKTAKQSRPMVESDSAHISSLSETSEGRLSYPNYLLYDPNYPDSPHEDVHYAGQIVTHYLVALTKQFKNKCGISSESDGGHDTATSYMMLLLAETLSEIGDLNAKGVDEFGAPFASNLYFNNLNPDSSYIWTQIMNPPTYRRFFQIFGKNINKYITGSTIGSTTIPGLCPSFTKNDSERLLDDYGLLLFKTYNDNGNSTTSRSVEYHNAVTTIPAGLALTPVSEDNRRKSLLVSKQLLGLAEPTTANPNRVGFYIIDNKTDMDGLLENLLFKGFTVPISTGVANTSYNNNNIKISPGEVVAVIPNLLNSSNSTMAGVQLLASDWDHVDIMDKAAGVIDDENAFFKPCVVDTTTTVDQGGESARTCTSTETTYKRLVKNSSGKFNPTGVAPVCFVQLAEDSSTRWVSQNEYRKKYQGLSLADKDCLGYSTSGTTDSDFTHNPHECLVRFLPGANEAFYSKIDAQKTYYESVVASSESKTFNSGNLLIMEVNRWVPPGTKFRCRLRARFSNCTDCYNDTTYSNDDFMDYEYNGHKPFKVINFDFTVYD